MKLKNSNSNKNITKKRIAFSAMLDSEYFFDRSAQIKMALKHDRVVSRDFHIKRAKSKIEIGKRKIKLKNIKDKNSESKNNTQESIKDDKKDIPLELYFLLLEYKNKFSKENIKFHSIKEYNDTVLSFWHYINKTNPTKKRKLLLKKYFPDNDNINNLYSDKVQKYSKNLFKSNPLLTYDNFSEIFFHYLSEFTQYGKNEKKMENCKIKIAKFLEKLKDYLEYIEIIRDNELDSISRDIKLRNSKFVKEYGIKIKNEMIRLKEEKNIQNNNDIKDSNKMINKTKNTLLSIEENKNVFEDPINFAPKRSYNFNLNINALQNNKIRKKQYFNKINLDNYKTPLSNSANKIRFFSPNKTGRMSSSISTGFIQSGKKNTIIPKKEEKKIIDNNEEENITNNSNSNKILNKLNSYSKININNNYKLFRRRYSSTFIDINMKNKLNNILKDMQNSKRKESSKKNFNGLELASAKNSDFSSIDDEGNKKSKNKYKSTYKLISISRDKKRISFFSPSNRKKSLQKKMINISNINNKISKQENGKKMNGINLKKEGLINIKTTTFNYNKCKDPLLILYDDLKNKPQIRKKEIDNIKKYLKSKGKSINPNFNPMDIIKEAKIITDKLDIERKTKRVFHPFLNYKQIEKLDDVNKLNDKVYGLDFEYMNQIFDFKSRNSESIQAQL